MTLYQRLMDREDEDEQRPVVISARLTTTEYEGLRTLLREEEIAQSIIGEDDDEGSTAIRSLLDRLTDRNRPTTDTP